MYIYIYIYIYTYIYIYIVSIYLYMYIPRRKVQILNICICTFRTLFTMAWYTYSHILHMTYSHTLHTCAPQRRYVESGISISRAALCVRARRTTRSIKTGPLSPSSSPKSATPHLVCWSDAPRWTSTPQSRPFPSFSPSIFICMRYGDCPGFCIQSHLT